MKLWKIEHEDRGQDRVADDRGVVHDVFVSAVRLLPFTTDELDEGQPMLIQDQMLEARIETSVQDAVKVSPSNPMAIRIRQEQLVIGQLIFQVIARDRADEAPQGLKLVLDE